MLVLGLQGSPRRKGNTHFLLTAFLAEAARLGAQTRIIEVDRQHIIPCKEYVVCEKKGYCPIDDDMQPEIFPLLRQAEVVVAASPIFFYNMTAQLKALIDRCQVLWARKYKLQLADPSSKTRRGFVLAVAATKGHNLFDGVLLTAKYFFDAISAHFDESLTYRQIEHFGDMQKHPTVQRDIKQAVSHLMTPFLHRKKVLFVGETNTCYSQMAWAFAQSAAGEKIEAFSAGHQPADKLNPKMVAVMAKKGIDMAFGRTKSVQEALGNLQPDVIVSIGSQERRVDIPSAQQEFWNLPDSADKSYDEIFSMGDEIQTKVRELCKKL